MRSAKRFEELWIWQQARDLVKQIYKDFESGAAAKDFAFRDQARRSVTSVMSNIAEGFERSTDEPLRRLVTLRPLMTLRLFDYF